MCPVWNIKLNCIIQKSSKNQKLIKLFENCPKPLHQVSTLIMIFPYIGWYVSVFNNKHNMNIKFMKRYLIFKNAHKNAIFISSINNKMILSVLIIHQKECLNTNQKWEKCSFLQNKNYKRK